MLRVSPQKLNLVAQLIRGRKASAALADLQFSRKRIAVDVKKCLESAIANAEKQPRPRGRRSRRRRGACRQRHRDEAFFAARPWPFGRVYKPFSHLTIVVRQVEAEAGA
jgi:large subunit ribosomal protein L22